VRYITTLIIDQQVEFILKCYKIILLWRGSSDGIVISLRKGRPTNGGQITLRRKRYLSSSKRPDQLLSLSSLLSMDPETLSPRI
jgi:hypothetical protein